MHNPIHTLWKGVCVELHVNLSEKGIARRLWMPLKGLCANLSEKGLPCWLCALLKSYLETPLKKGLPRGLHACNLQVVVCKPSWKVMCMEVACKPLWKVSWKGFGLWEKRIWILQNQSECSKMLCTNHERSPKTGFIFPFSPRLTYHAGNWGQSPTVIRVHYIVLYNIILYLRSKHSNLKLLTTII